MGLCVAFIALVRLPSLKVSTLLLTGLLLYDVFWVFFSSYIFNSNVMVRVATRTADNPMRALARRFNVDSNMINDAPKLSLPGKLVFPRYCCENTVNVKFTLLTDKHDVVWIFAVLRHLVSIPCLDWEIL